MRSNRCELLETRRLLAGVTLITHGFNGNADGWVNAMADAIIDRVGDASDVAEYKLTISGSSAPTGATLANQSAPVNGTPLKWSAAETGDAVIKLDWSSLSGGITTGSIPTGTVARYVTDWLLGHTIDGVAFASVPIHLIGHSRGASLVNAIARDLGEAGIVVHQETALDPHPVDGVRDPYIPWAPSSQFDFGDEAMNLPASVVYADNFWRTDGEHSFDFTGESIAGAVNTQLDETVLTAGGGSGQHSAVHAWYHGTASLTATGDNDGYTIPASFYAPPNPGSRASVGWNRSRAADFTTALSDYGMNFGGSAARTAVNLTTATPWSNLVTLTVNDADGEFALGSAVPLDLRYVDADGLGSIEFFLDGNENPFDAGATSLGTFDPASSGAWPTAAAASASVTIPTDAADGLRYLYARIHRPDGRDRFFYVAQPLLLADGRAEVVTKQWTKAAGTVSWADAGNWTPTGTPGAADRVAVRSSGAAISVPASRILGQSVSLLDGTIEVGGGAVASAATYRQTASATLRFRIDSAATFGKLSVSTRAVLSGTLDVAVGFAPTARQTFELIAGGVVAGRFSDVSTSLTGALVPVPTYQSDRVTITIAQRGDMNNDGAVNNADIAPFVQGLTDVSGFAAQYGYAPMLLGDVNLDGAFNNSDIAAFVGALTGSRLSAIIAVNDVTRPSKRGSIAAEVLGPGSLAV